MDPTQLWFNTPDTDTLCRGGTNGPAHLSQLYAIRKYVKDGMNLLDYGCGSATTFEAIKTGLPDLKIDYTGTDIIPKNIEWDTKTFPEGKFVVNTEVNKITQSDKSFDVVYSRHVVDHMSGFENALDEHCLVAKKLVIIILWYSLYEGDDHIIKNIDYSHEENGRVYPDEYLNRYSKKKVLEYIDSKEDWKLLELTEEVGTHDIVIVLEHK